MTFLNSIEYFLDNFELYNDKTANEQHMATTKAAKQAK